MKKIILFLWVLFIGCNPAWIKPKTPEVLVTPMPTTETNEVIIKIKTYNEPKLAEIIETLKKTYIEPTVDYDGFRDKKGNFIVTEKINFYKDGKIVATITIFEGEIVLIKSNKVDLSDTIYKSKDE